MLRDLCFASGPIKGSRLGVSHVRLRGYSVGLAQVHRPALGMKKVVIQSLQMQPFVFIIDLLNHGLI